jgi:hypothetical protein
MPSDPPDPAAALEALLPQLRRIQAEGWALILAAAALCVIGAWPILTTIRGSGETDARLWGIVAGLGFVGVGSAPAWTRRRQEARILPALTRALDLDYRQSDPAFAAGLPGRLLPSHGRRTAENVLSGRLAGRVMRFAETKVVTGGKHQTLLFGGIVIEMPLERELPSCFVALQSETVGWFGRAGYIGISDLVRLETVWRHGDEYGVWSSSAEAAAHPGFRAVLDVLTDAGSVAGPGVRLYTAMGDRRTIWLACRQKRDLFRIGGLFATRDSLFADLQRASEDMSQPLRLISALIEAETRAAEAGAAPLAP